MKTSQEWWNEVKIDPVKTVDWLKKQYIGEVSASFRVAEFAERYAEGRRANMTLQLIAIQEGQHADWIGHLLTTRGVNLDDIHHANTRYWNQTLKGIQDFTSGCAVAAHAEAMRLERIRVICDDLSAPEDIRGVFLKILPDELWHEKAFRNLSTPEAMAHTQSNHEAGCNALGLVI